MAAAEKFFARKQQETAIFLNEVQQKAVSHTSGPLLLLASPGSGKTTTIIMKIGYLIEERGINPTRIKALTFSKAAAVDMQQRFKRLFPQLAPVGFSTIHSFAYEVARAYFRSRQISYYIIEGDSADEREQPQTNEPSLHKKHILRSLFLSIVGETITDDQMDELTTYISYIKNKLIPAEQWSQVRCDVPHAEQILQAYEQFKRSGHHRLLLDFDDMLAVANQALQEDEQLLRSYQQQFDYVLTDESQDTSLVQHYIIERLVAGHRQLCVVADDDQSIYSWRGAEPAYLLNFKAVYPDATILFMEQNYRSTSTIVYAANQFISRNKQRYPKQMFTDNGSGDPIRLRVSANPAEQTKYIVQQIQGLQQLAEVAVLYRNNSSSVALINALDRAGIPFYVKDADQRFFSHWVVEDILNFMRMSYTDKRVDLLEKIHLKFNGYISKQQMAALKEISNQQSVFDNLLQYVQLHDYQVQPLLNSKETFQQMKGMPPLPAIGVIRERLGYERAIEKMCERLGFRKEYLIGMLNTLEEIAAELDTMEQFAARLKHLQQVLTRSRQRRNEHAVTLSTLHSAKGLEFDYVFMIDLVEGIIPSKHDVKADELEEAARLFYVGMTRAKRELELITYTERGGEKAAESRFVTAVRDIVNPPKQHASAVEQSASSSSTLQAQPSQPPKHPNAIVSKEQLQVNLPVTHTKFGAGVIIACGDERVTIQFAESTKQLAIAPCLENGLLLLEGEAAVLAASTSS